MRAQQRRPWAQTRLGDGISLEGSAGDVRAQCDSIAPGPPALAHQLLRGALLFSLSFCHCCFGLGHELFPGCSDCQGHFTAEGFFGSVDSMCSQLLCRPRGPDVFRNLSGCRICQVACVHSACLGPRPLPCPPQWSTGWYLVRYFCSLNIRMWNFHSGCDLQGPRDPSVRAGFAGRRIIRIPPRFSEVPVLFPCGTAGRW